MLAFEMKGFFVPLHETVFSLKKKKERKKKGFNLKLNLSKKSGGL